MFFHSVYELSIGALKEATPAVILWICIDADSAHGESLEHWLEGAWGKFEFSTPDLDQLAAIFPTGGTTGPSKGACHTHRSLAFMMQGLVSSWNFDHSSRMLSVAPLSHAAGLFALALVPNGATNVILPNFNADLVLATIVAERITHIFLPPTALYALMVHPGIERADVSSLRCLVIGAAPVAPEKFKQAVELFGPILHEGYAQSETGMPVLNKYPTDYLLPDGTFDEAILRSAGRAATFVRVEIVDDDGKILPRGQRGEIAIRASQLMRGYYKRPAETEEVSRNGFHLSGDIGIMDDRGYVTIVDRKKDMIVTGGFNVFPAEVESVIYGHDTVLDCIVIGVPEEKWGEAIRALVQLKPGCSIEPEEMISFCKERLGSVKSPKVVEIVKELPRSPVGKLLRREARAKYWDGHWRSV